MEIKLCMADIIQLKLAGVISDSEAADFIKQLNEKKELSSPETASDGGAEK